MSEFVVHSADHLSAHVRGLRREAGLTQADLANLIGVHKTRVSYIERDLSVVSTAQFFGILSAIGVDLVLRKHD